MLCISSACVDLRDLELCLAAVKDVRVWLYSVCKGSQDGGHWPLIGGALSSDGVAEAVKMHRPSQEVHTIEVPIAGLEASLVARVAAVRIDGRYYTAY